MTEQMLDRQQKHRLAVLRHAEEVTGNVAATCRYYGISRSLFYTWQRRFDAEGVDGLKGRSRRPRTSPNATHTEVVGKIIYLRQNYHFGVGTPSPGVPTPQLTGRCRLVGGALRAISHPY
jgi:transposase-like protein